jgi:hypothetical protein
MESIKKLSKRLNTEEIFKSLIVLKLHFAKIVII